MVISFLQFCATIGKISMSIGKGELACISFVAPQAVTCQAQMETLLQLHRCES
jgi:hypothetical protein